MKQKNFDWLKRDVFPLWLEKGIHTKTGSFVESLSVLGEPEDIPQRAMVQTRQIYALTEAFKMQVLERGHIEGILKTNFEFLGNYFQENGSVLHAVDSNGQPVQMQSELYTQAFMLFGLARLFEFFQDAKLKANVKSRAVKLLHYLQSERAHSQGGFTEIKNGQVGYHSNPHMHLFEASLEWQRVDRDPLWEKLSEQLSGLCLSKFMNNTIGVVAEFFSSEWQPELDHGRFIFEPGHQFEWAWLFLQYGRLVKKDFSGLSRKLNDTAEAHGVKSGFAVDELWSDFSVKKGSARFWPQCERIKAAVDLGNGTTADQALESLYAYLNVSKTGLWVDTREPDGRIIHQSAKASSLYHIINAMSEYNLKR